MSDEPEDSPGAPTFRLCRLVALWLAVPLGTLVLPLTTGTPAFRYVLFASGMALGALAMAVLIDWLLDTTPSPSPSHVPART